MSQVDNNELKYRQNIQQTQANQKVEKTKEQISKVVHTILQLVPNDSATKTKITRIAQELYDYADSHNGAVGQEGFTKLLKEITSLNVVGVIMKYNELYNSSTSTLSDNETLIETILDETSSDKNDIIEALLGDGNGKNGIRGLFTLLLDRAKEVGMDDATIKSYRSQFEKALNKELGGAAFLRSSAKMDEIIETVIQSIKNHIEENNKAAKEATKKDVPAKTHETKATNTIVRRYNKALKDFNAQMKADGWAEDIADAMGRLWGKNYADAVRKDLKIAKEQTKRLKAALAKGDEAFRAEFLNIFGIAYDPANITAYQNAESTYVAATQAKANEDNFTSQFALLLNNKPLSKEYGTRTSTSMTANLTTTYISATEEQVFERELNKMAALYDSAIKANPNNFKLTRTKFFHADNKIELGKKSSNAPTQETFIPTGKEFLERIFIEKNANTLEEKYAVLADIAKQTATSLASETKKACGGRSYDAVAQRYEQCYKAAYGLENDILKRVTDYNVSQQKGGGAVKGATVALVAIGLGMLTSGAGSAAVAGGTGAAVAGGATATSATVGALKGAATVALTTAAVEITDKFTSKEALDALRNDGVLAFLEKGYEVTDWKQIATASLVSGTMCLMFAGQSYAITNLTMKAATAAGMGAEAAGYTAAALSSTGFIATGLGTEYIFQGEITVEGASFTVIMALVSGVMQVKQVYKTSQAAKAQAQEEILQKVADARKALGFAEDEVINLDKAEKAYKEIAKVHHPNSSARTGDGAMHDAIFAAAQNAIEVLRKHAALINAKVPYNTGTTAQSAQPKQLTAQPEIGNVKTSGETAIAPVTSQSAVEVPISPSVGAVAASVNGPVAKSGVVSSGTKNTYVKPKMSQISLTAKEDLLSSRSDISDGSALDELKEKYPDFAQRYLSQTLADGSPRFTAEQLLRLAEFYDNEPAKIMPILNHQVRTNNGGITYKYDGNCIDAIIKTYNEGNPEKTELLEKLLKGDKSVYPDGKVQLLPSQVIIDRLAEYDTAHSAEAEVPVKPHAKAAVSIKELEAQDQLNGNNEYAKLKSTLEAEQIDGKPRFTEDEISDILAKIAQNPSNIKEILTEYFTIQTPYGDVIDAEAYMRAMKSTLPIKDSNVKVTGAVETPPSVQDNSDAANISPKVQEKIDRVRAVLEAAKASGEKLTFNELAKRANITPTSLTNYLSGKYADKFGLKGLWNDVKKHSEINIKGYISPKVQENINKIKQYLSEQKQPVSAKQVAGDLGIPYSTLYNMLTNPRFGLTELWNEVKALEPKSHDNTPDTQSAVTSNTSKTEIPATVSQEYEFKTPDRSISPHELYAETKGTNEKLFEKGQRLLNNLLKNIHDDAKVTEPIVVTVGNNHFGFTIDITPEGNRLVTVKNWLGDKESWNVAANIEEGFTFELDANGEMVNGKYFTGDNEGLEYSYTFRHNENGEKVITYEENHYAFEYLYRKSATPTSSYSREFIQSNVSSDTWVVKYDSTDNFDGEKWRFTEEENLELSTFEFGPEPFETNLMNMFLDYANADRKVGVGAAITNSQKPAVQSSTEAPVPVQIPDTPKPTPVSAPAETPSPEPTPAQDSTQIPEETPTQPTEPEFTPTPETSSQTTVSSKYEFKEPDRYVSESTMIDEATGTNIELFEKGERLLANLLKNLPENAEVKEPKVLTVGNNHLGFTIETISDGKRLITIKNWLGDKVSWEADPAVEEEARFVLDENGEMLEGSFSWTHFDGNRYKTDYVYNYSRLDNGDAIITYQENAYFRPSIYKQVFVPHSSDQRVYVQSPEDPDIWVAKEEYDEIMSGESWQSSLTDYDTAQIEPAFGYESGNANLMNIFLDYARSGQNRSISVPKTKYAKVSSGEITTPTSPLSGVTPQQRTAVQPEKANAALAKIRDKVDIEQIKKYIKPEVYQKVAISYKNNELGLNQYIDELLNQIIYKADKLLPETRTFLRDIVKDIVMSEVKDIDIPKNITRQEIEVLLNEKLSDLSGINFADKPLQVKDILSTKEILETFKEQGLNRGEIAVICNTTDVTMRTILNKNGIEIDGRKKTQTSTEAVSETKKEEAEAEIGTDAETEVGQTSGEVVAVDIKVERSILDYRTRGFSIVQIATSLKMDVLEVAKILKNEGLLNISDTTKRLDVEKMKSLYKTKLYSLDEIAQKCQCSKQDVDLALRYEGVIKLRKVPDTTKVAKILYMIRKDYSTPIQIIANEIGEKPVYVMQRLAENRVKTKAQMKTDAKLRFNFDREVVSLYNFGLKISDMQSVFGCSRETLIETLQQNGKLNAQSKLKNSENYNEIKQCKEQGLGTKDIADLVEESPDVVNEILLELSFREEISNKAVVPSTSTTSTETQGRSSSQTSGGADSLAGTQGRSGNVGVPDSADAETVRLAQKAENEKWLKLYKKEYAEIESFINENQEIFTEEQKVLVEEFQTMLENVKSGNNAYEDIDSLYDKILSLKTELEVASSDKTTEIKLLSEGLESIQKQLNESGIDFDLSDYKIYEGDTVERIKNAEFICNTFAVCGEDMDLAVSIIKHCEKYMDDRGLLDINRQNEYIFALNELENPEIGTINLELMQTINKLIKDSKISRNQGVEYVIKLKDLSAEKPLEKITITDFSDEFDINNPVERRIIESFYKEVYMKNDTEDFATLRNGEGTVEVTLTAEAKVQLSELFSDAKNYISKMILFEKALKKSAASENDNGIKKETWKEGSHTLVLYVLKVIMGNSHIRIADSQGNFKFDTVINGTWKGKDGNDKATDEKLKNLARKIYRGKNNK